MTIHPETDPDHAAVFAVHETAFGRSDEARIAARLRGDTQAFVPELSLVARQNGIIVGHVIFSVGQVVGERETVPVLALGPIGVLPAHQKQGIGSALIHSGIEKAMNLGYPAIVLLGHPSYYPRFGFLPVRLPVPRAG